MERAPREPDDNTVSALGTCLFTLVDPRPGRARAYNRWYERDHFYAGMMTGPHVFAGRRWVAPRRLRELPDAFGRGTFLSTYWIERGGHDAFLGWATDAVRRLVAAGRMFEERDHVHTAFYELGESEGHDLDGVPPELALDHPFPGLIAALGGTPPPAVGPVALRLTWLPLPTPGFEGSSETLHLCFVEGDPADGWDEVRHAAGDASWVAGFVPTVPGTDRYLDEL